MVASKPSEENDAGLAREMDANQRAAHFKEFVTTQAADGEVTAQKEQERPVPNDQEAQLDGHAVKAEQPDTGLDPLNMALENLNNESAQPTSQNLSEAVDIESQNCNQDQELHEMELETALQFEEPGYMRFQNAPPLYAGKCHKVARATKKFVKAQIKAEKLVLYNEEIDQKYGTKSAVGAALKLQRKAQNKMRQ